MPEPSLVQANFTRIAHRYDLANRIISFGLDRSWRRLLIRRVCEAAPRQVVDLATGTGDVALALRKALPAPVRVTGMDFTPAMLEVARRRQLSQRPSTSGGGALDFRHGDCLDLPLEDASVDALTIAYGLRNLADRPAGLREMRRVLRPGGLLVCLEFTQPAAWLRPFFFFYLRFILPPLARLLTGDREAYQYLAGTVQSYPPMEVISAEMEDAGLVQVKATPLTLRVMALHEARAPSA